jgi:ABC-type methionine transport system ATPase subunit
MITMTTIETQSIRIQIPQKLHQVPIISQLITDYQLGVNIRAAVLDHKATGGGWFDLSLTGDADQLQTAIDNLKQIGVQIWDE